MAVQKKAQSSGPILALILMIVLATVNYVMLSQIGGVIPAGSLYYFVGAPLLAGLILFIIWRQTASAPPDEEPDRSAPAAEPRPPRVTAMPPKPTPAPALTLLAALQLDGRLVDFLQEQLAGYSDEQIGAAVRAVHEGCRKVLAERITLEPVLRGGEGDTVVVPEGFDPSAIRLTGNVVGQPPFRGTLRHHGWRATQVKLIERPAGQDPNIIAPAEVEIS